MPSLKHEAVTVCIEQDFILHVWDQTGKRHEAELCVVSYQCAASVRGQGEAHCSIVAVRGRDSTAERDPNLLCADLKRGAGWRVRAAELWNDDSLRRNETELWVWWWIVWFSWPIWRSYLAAVVRQSGSALVWKCILYLFKWWKKIKGNKNWVSALELF